MARRPDEDDDDAGDDGEYVVTGEELKKLVRLGRKRPMPFAFCPSAGDDVSLFATHRKKAAKRIGKATKADSGQTRVAWGTFVIVDRVMVLTCERALPTIAKKLKKHMRAERLPLNIRVLDATGAELESDIEDLSAEDDPFAGLDHDDGDDGLPDVGAVGGDRLKARLAALSGAVQAATGDAGDRARDLFAAALRATDVGSRDKAQKLVSLVENEMRRLRNSGNRPTVRGPVQRPGLTSDTRAAEVATVEAENAARKAMDDVALPDAAEAARVKRAATLAARRVASLRPRVEALEREVADKLTSALALVARQLRAGETAGTDGALDRIEAALERVEARAQG